ncbi:O-antigen ligase family protein [Spirosoma soli]|uniref:O-antigen ligase family protein n=1 Tax=Spirosoma soli TaxID=1770529 RepID=A0ABW5LYN6_9BACT
MNIKTWIYRIALYALLFGVSALTYGGNALSPFLEKAVNGIALLGIPALVLFYFYQPGVYKVAAWALFLGVVLLVIESQYEYGKPVYSYFVIKRFAYCGLALSAYFVAARAGVLKIKYAVNIIFGLYVVNQLFLGQIFSYALTSETRTTSAPEAFYLVIPFLYYTVRYFTEKKIWDLFGSVAVFGFIVFLLHRSVMSSAAVAGLLVTGLAAIGKISDGSLNVRRTLGTVMVVTLASLPFLGIMGSIKADGFMEQIAGIFDPAEDNTGSWRLEQITHYMNQFNDRPLLGWRYEGYDRGEIMENEDFPEKGTIIHSQYVDMLYNYGVVGLAINLFIILGTLYVMYRRNPTFSTEQAVLFGFIASGLLFGISYQLPVFYWGFVGLGMFYGLHRQPDDVNPDDYDMVENEDDEHQDNPTVYTPQISI